MKQINILIILILTSQQLLLSQIYDPILDTAKQWNVLNIGSPPSGGDYYATQSYKFIGDTMFNNYHYKKIGVSSGILYPYVFTGFIMREDSSGKVFGATFYSNEFQHQGLMYDFSLNVGDTITPYSEMGYYQYGLNYEVLKTDTVFFANKYRKRLVLGFTGTTDSCEFWYEGIGSRLGLLYPGLLIFDNSTELLCYYESDTLLWFNSIFPNCWYNNVSINNVSSNSTINIFPNPANDKLNIAINEDAQLEIINAQGQIVDSKNLIKESNNLDISNLPTGVYTLKITTDNVIAVRKLLKQ